MMIIYYGYALHIRGLHWVCAPAGPNANLAGAGGFTFAAGGSGRSENFAGDGGIWRVIEIESTQVEKEIKAAVYLTKAKQGKSDIWKQFWIVTEKKGELNLLVSCNKCAKVFVYNEHKSGTSALRRHTYFLSSMCLFI